MPDIRVMTWNIQNTSTVKLRLPGFMTAVARTVAAANVDILLIVEIAAGTDDQALDSLCQELNRQERAINAGAGEHCWLGYFLTPPTGRERYCAVIRNLDMIRPVHPEERHSEELTDMTGDVHFDVWPSSDFAQPAYPIGNQLPKIPLCGLHVAVGVEHQTRRKRDFHGKRIGNGGNSLGEGFRLLALPMFWIHTPTQQDYLLPVVVGHYAAVRGANDNNILAQGQMGQLPGLHLSQLYDRLGVGQYINVRDGGNFRAVRIQEICFTGDFNIDFLRNAPDGKDSIARKNRNALGALTPTVQHGTSEKPAALPPPAAPPPTQPTPVAPLPENQLFPLSLRAAVTNQGTILRFPKPPQQPTSFTTAAFDNFFYGGTRLHDARLGQSPGGRDSGEVIPLYNSIVQPGGQLQPGEIDISALAAHHAELQKNSAHLAPNLQANAGAGPALTDLDRLIGARLISDHLPIVLQFNCP
ncbi:hypothetical protein ACH4YO_31410 [Streptomyces noursei]|uniref:hypothetical protein n=1 Tax=Streptomyces noursei TaxID=1971 RepID=UPI0037AAFDE3